MVDVILLVTTEFVSMELEFLCLAHYLHYIFILDQNYFLLYRKMLLHYILYQIRMLRLYILSIITRQCNYWDLTTDCSTGRFSGNVSWPLPDYSGAIAKLGGEYLPLYWLVYAHYTHVKFLNNRVQIRIRPFCDFSACMHIIATTTCVQEVNQMPMFFY